MRRRRSAPSRSLFCNLISSGRFVMLCVALQWVKMSNEKRNETKKGSKMRKQMLCIFATGKCIEADIRLAAPSTKLLYCATVCVRTVHSTTEWHRIHFVHDVVVVRYACRNLRKNNIRIRNERRRATYTSVCIQSHDVFRCIMFIDSLHTKTTPSSPPRPIWRKERQIPLCACHAMRSHFPRSF